MSKLFQLKIIFIVIALFFISCKNNATNPTKSDTEKDPLKAFLKEYEAVYCNRQNNSIYKAKYKIKDGKLYQQVGTSKAWTANQIHNITLENNILKVTISPDEIVEFYFVKEGKGIRLEEKHSQDLINLYFNYDLLENYKGFYKGSVKSFRIDEEGTMEYYGRDYTMYSFLRGNKLEIVGEYPVYDYILFSDDKQIATAYENGKVVETFTNISIN